MFMLCGNWRVPHAVAKVNIAAVVLLGVRFVGKDLFF